MEKHSGPRLSVMTVTWNGWEHTRRCLASVLTFTGQDFEVLVLDNASQDGTADNIDRLFPDVRVVRNEENRGHTKAVNQGVALAAGKYILLLDSDTELVGDVIRQMLDFIDTHHNVALVAPRTFNTDGSVQLSARRFPRPMNGLFGRQSLLTRWFPGNRLSRRYLLSDRVSDSEPYEVEQISSACMMFRRELFSEVGPWDEGYPGYWVDSDWCYRVRVRGEKIYCVPGAQIIHHEQNRRGTKKSLRRIWMFHYGAYRFYRNNMTWGVFDPRAVAAAIALCVHGLAQLAHNVVLPRAEPNAIASNSE